MENNDTKKEKRERESRDNAGCGDSAAAHEAAMHSWMELEEKSQDVS